VSDMGRTLAPSVRGLSYATAVIRQLFRGRVWNAVPVLVVHDDPDTTVLWLPTGCTYAIGNDLFGDWTHELRVAERGQLRVTRRGDPFSIFLFTNDDGSFRGWYANLERPQRRTAIGFDYEDELLDVWVPLGGEPELLDEDELEEAVARGFLSPDRAVEIRDVADRVLAERPWPTGWEGWRPEPGWQVPVLPADWSAGRFGR
jgi:hypothetical protein